MTLKLTKIKLAGFKSFVDPTTVYLPSNLIAIVGPNGCGKSNIIDAVRWVMGESSAKNLRGESMADVIFNGSNARKPVGQAAIELLFDNSDGSVGGQYASFGEISVKRLVSRDGVSNYYLNGTRCRKKDITDVFLGTGLGPRSYSIIEQGMISRLIEAKPEDLRVYLEEAAGISKYKERRRETELRISHTRENLSRLNDVRDEIDKQLQRLQRQANTAEKYQLLKEEERRLAAEFLVLRLNELDRDISTQQLRVSEKENRIEESVAEQRAVEAALERDRAAQHETADAFSLIQGRFYGIGGEIGRVEQAIQHARDMRHKQEQDLEEINVNSSDITAQRDQDQARLESLKASVAQTEPQLTKAREQVRVTQETLQHAEQKMHDWQKHWDDFSLRAAQPSETMQVERMRIQQLERMSAQHQQRLERLLPEKNTLQTELAGQSLGVMRSRHSTAEVGQARHESELTQCVQEISVRKESLRYQTEELEQARDEYQEARAELIALEARYAASLEAADSDMPNWLEQCGLLNAPKLAESIEVESGWERAVEMVLGKQLNALGVEHIDAVPGLLSSLNKGPVNLFERHTAVAPIRPGTLAACASAPWPIADLMSRVYTADSLEQALVRRRSLEPGESVVTREGVWLGAHWLRVHYASKDEINVFAAKKRIDVLRANLELLTEQGQQLKESLDQTQEFLLDLEQRRDDLQNEQREIQRELNSAEGEVQAAEIRSSQIEKRIQEIEEDLSETEQALQNAAQEVIVAQERLENAEREVQQFDNERQRVVQERDDIQSSLGQARHNAQEASDQAHQMELAFSSYQNQLDGTRQHLDRMQKQWDDLVQRRSAISQQYLDSEAPLLAKQAELNKLLEQRVLVENELLEARVALDALDQALRDQETHRTKVEKKIQGIRQELDEFKMAWQEVRIRHQTVREQFDASGFDLQTLKDNLSAEAEAKEWQEKLKQMESRIARLGAINLAAIDEYKEQQERKEYLDKQYQDVSDALNTLENAIRKIDKETRARFKETFEKVNQGLNALFPRLFGGGHAYLELTEDDLLNAGVTIMARPPGKRNSTIHLLSGGEKALTAVAMVFSIFLLNPSPFCMLDEVDAPLDDANVGRFCELVKEMSKQVQFIIITHNKITMSIANQLSGVTMQEAGVSRMVAVDVDEAIRLAAV